MAISPTTISLFPLKHDQYSQLFSSRNKSMFGLNLATTKSSTIISTKVVSKTSAESLSSMIITRRDKEEAQHLQQEEKSSDEDQTIANIWRELHGEDDWVGMLDPMNPHLRTELIRYGEMAQACYDAFDFDPFSKYCGSCRFTRRTFFNSLGMTNLGYEVSRYLYATSNINLPNFFKKSRWPKVWSKNANWIGYVAVSNDETSKKLGRRDITIAWRGTVTRLEWIVDLMDFLKPINSNKIPCPDPSVKVESGFVDLYTDKDENDRFCKFSAREQVLTEIKRLIELYPNEEISITITGHSLGAALAILNAYDIAETGINIACDGTTMPVSVFSFSGPRVGNARFKERMELLGVKVLRAVNLHDVVPKTPGFFLNENVAPALMKMAEGLPWSYSHVGVELCLDHKNSPFLKATNDPVCSHNLEALLHLIDGYHGKGHRFVLASGRDPALVNKASDFLKDHYLVPPCWRQDQNKGLIRNTDGRWMQQERSKFDDHPADMQQQLKQLGILASDDEQHKKFQ
ncbi:hypothetical protein ACFE04_031714 [Oxalis oulophora]